MESNPSILRSSPFSPPASACITSSSTSSCPTRGSESTSPLLYYPFHNDLGLIKRISYSFRREIESSSSKLYAELMIRAGDNVERISDRAEEAVQSMLDQEKVRQSGVIQEKLSASIEKKEPPKQVLSRVELALWLVKDRDGESDPGAGVSRLTDMALKAAAHSSPAVRTVGEKLVLELHARAPEKVRRRLPTESSDLRPLRKVLEKMEQRESRKRSEK